MHATLYTGATKLARQQAATKQLEKWNISTVDIVRIDQVGEHITIDEIRAFCKKLLLSPAQSQYHVGVIDNASAMTVEAQNALLKMLEEPPSRVQILLETASEDMLLPTVISRCQIIRVAGVQEENVHIPLRALLDASVGERLTLLDECAKDRRAAKQFVADAMLAAEVMLYTEEEKKRVAALLRKLVQAQKQLEANCNPKLVLDRAFFL